MNEVMLHPKHKLLASVAEAWPEGSEHTHKEIAQIIGIPTKTPAYYNVVSQAWLLLEAKKGIVMMLEHNQGYRVALPDEHTTASQGHVQKAFKRFGRGLSISINAPVERMTPEGRARHTQYTDRLRQHEAMMRGTDREIRQLADPKIKMTR